MDADKILREMEKNSGEVCNPLILTSKIMPEWIPRQAEEGKFVMTLPNVPPKYKQLIIISGPQPSRTNSVLSISSRSGHTWA